jgi:Arc/MetJ family transcription regulator
MRTNIVIDDALMRQAMQASDALSKLVAVVLVLSTLVRLQQQGDIRASRSSMAAVVAQSKSPRFIPAQPQWVSSSPGLSASLSAPADCLNPFPCVGTLQQQLIFAVTQAGTSGKLQSKRIFKGTSKIAKWT